MEKKLFLSMTEQQCGGQRPARDSKESVPAEQECGGVLGIGEAAWAISNPMVRVKQLASPCLAL